MMMIIMISHWKLFKKLKFDHKPESAQVNQTDKIL